MFCPENLNYKQVRRRRDRQGDVLSQIAHTLTRILFSAVLLCHLYLDKNQAVAHS